MSINLQAKVTDSGGAIATKDFTIFVPSPGGDTVPVPSSIDATGATDVSVQMQAFADSLLAGTTVEFPPGAIYRCENILLFTEPQDLVLHGNGATIKAITDGSGVVPDDAHKHLWPRQRSHVEFWGGSNIRVEDLNVVGANPNAGAEKGAYVAAIEGQHAFDVRGVDGIALINCNANDTYGDLLYFGGGPNGQTKNALVRGGTYTRSGRQGLAVVDCNGFLGEDFYLGEVGRTMIDLEPTANQVVENYLLQRVTLGACRHLLHHSGGAGITRNATMQDCIVGAVGMKVVVHLSPGSPAGRRLGPHAFLRNVANGAPGPQPPFRFEATDGVTVVENVAPVQASRNKSFCWVDDCTDIDVHDNEIGDATMELEVV